MGGFGGESSRCKGFLVGKGSVSLLREVISWEGSTREGDMELGWFDQLDGEENSKTGF